MRTVIVGCGRVGTMLAVMLEDGGHQVSILDISTAAFDRLPGSFKGNAIRGDGTDEDTLRRAGAGDADLFLAVTEGDNRPDGQRDPVVSEAAGRGGTRCPLGQRQPPPRCPAG
jgi:voltage-gated potassium channel Kch